MATPFANAVRVLEDKMRAEAICFADQLGTTMPHFTPSLIRILHPVVETLVRTEVKSLALVAKKKTVSMDDVKTLRLVTSARFNEAARDAHINNRGTKRPRDQAGQSGTALLGDSAMTATTDSTMAELASTLSDSTIKKATAGVRMDAAIREHLKLNWLQTIYLLMEGAAGSAGKAKRKNVAPADVVNALKYEAMVYAGYKPYTKEIPRAQAGCAAFPAPVFSAASQPCAKCRHPTGCNCED